ncbi:MAG TPA: BatA domain-containing protein [Tepidisphaeraceae bacterium]|jgi:Mg-chelatase subunit ChlD
MFLTFSNTVLLIGLAGAVVPLVLHLLSRARYQSVDWGAMLFLEGLDARQQYSGKINQILLLLIRMAVVALLAVGLAQPVLQQWSPEADAGAAALHAADRGELLCIGGAVACAGAVAGMVLLIARSIGSTPSWGRRAAYMAVAIVAGVGAVALARRAAAWDVEVRKLMTLQPQAKARPTGGALRPRIDAALLLDCSASMNFEENGHTRFGLAQGAAKQVLAGLHRGDRVSLVLLGQRESDQQMEPTADLQSVADRIDAARPGRQPADVADGLLKAQQVLDREGAPACDLYVVCDRQASNWRGATDYFMTQAWPAAVARSNAAVRLFIVPVGDADADNIAVENIELTNPPAIVGQHADVAVDVHNYGSTSRAAVPLTVSVNGRSAFDTTVSVAAGRVAHVSVPIKAGDFNAAGPQVVTAEVRTAGYRDDDRLDAIVDAIDPIKVLVISGDEWDTAGATGQFRNESDFLRLALAPQQTLRRKGPDPCKVEVLPAEQWTADLDLGRYQVVILANIERFTPAQSRAIEQYAYGGGGVLVAPGSLARVDSYNEQLWRDGAGILPAELEDATAADGSEATAIVGYDPSTPVFRFLHDQPDLTLTSTIGRYFPTNARPSDAHTLAWYTSGAPFLIESRAGRGKVLLMTTSLDADWSTLPLSTFYLPFVQSAVRYLAAGTLPSRNLQLGEPIEAAFDEPADDRATIELPDGDQRQVSLASFGAGGDLRFTETNDPGVYRVHVRERAGDRLLLFAVRPSHEESDLTQLTDARWDELERGLHLRRIDPNERAIATVVAGSREGIDLWPWAIAAVMVLAAVELGLARHWSREAY